LRHYRVQGVQFIDLGPIGPGGEPVRVGDDVRLELEFSEPAYAYLLALNTNGKVQLCLPEDDDQAPPRAARLVLYPDQKDYFMLTEGPGVQAFVAVARRGPLPPYRASGLKAALEQLWTHVAAPGVWRYDGDQVTPEPPPSPESRVRLGGTRGEKKRRVPEPFVRACQFLRDRPGVEAVAAVAFPVAADAKAPAP
jgi:hypothetical protein